MAKRGPIGLGDVHTQLRIVNRLLAAGLKGHMKQQEIVELLVGTGLGPQEIADILNTTPSTVGVAMHRYRSRSGKRTGAKGDATT